MKIKNGEIETKNYQVWFNFPFVARDEETDKWGVWNILPRFKFCDERKKKDYVMRYYEWMLDLGYISVWKKHHPLYDETAKKYNWNAVF